MRYRIIMGQAWVKTPDEINTLIEGEDHPSLTSADQIISVSYDDSRKEYLVTWRVRKWLDGSEGA